jgi:hypothetical protein
VPQHWIHYTELNTKRAQECKPAKTS